MHQDNRQEMIFIKDIRPGLKNINVVFIILEAGQVTFTKENREVRTFKVGDITACINVSIWDEPGRLLVPGDIVKLTRAYASIWRNSLTLYSGKNGEIIKMGDFNMIFNEQLNMSEPNPNMSLTQAQPQVNSNNNGSNLVITPAAPVSAGVTTPEASRSDVVAPTGKNQTKSSNPRNSRAKQNASLKTDGRRYNR